MHRESINIKNDDAHMKTSKSFKMNTLRTMILTNSHIDFP